MVTSDSITQTYELPSGRQVRAVRSGLLIWYTLLDDGQELGQARVMVGRPNGSETAHVKLEVIAMDVRGHGYGSELLDFLVSFYAEAGLYGTVERLGSGRGRLSTSALKAWYRRHGAVVGHRGSLTWERQR